MRTIWGSMVDCHILRRSSWGSLGNGVNVLRVLMTFVEFQVVFKRMKISSDVLVVATQTSNTQPLSCSLKVKDIIGPD
jgi:hypothetical protein